MLSKQEVFNKVALHLLKQFTKSARLDDGNICMYRSPNGNKCAVGVLIPDEMYSEKMEWLNSSQLLTGFPQLQSLFKEDEFFTIHSLLMDCQCIHDYDDPEKWYDQLLSLAERYELNLDVIQQRDAF